jgi:hypothetical protein
MEDIRGAHPAQNISYARTVEQRIEDCYRGDMEATQAFDLIFVLLIAVALANALLAFIVARARRRVENHLFALVALFVALWTLTNALFRITGNINSATLLAQLSYFAALGTAASFWHFTWIYPRPLRSSRLDTRAHRLALYGLGALLASSAFVPGFVVRSIDLETRSILTGPGLYLLAAFMLATWLAAFKRLVHQQGSLRGRSRAQARYVLYGSVLAAAFGLFFNLLLPLWNDYRFVWLGPLFSLFFVGFSAYSIVAHHLFDVRLLIRRTLVYTVLLSILAGSFAAFEKGLEHFLRPLLGSDNFATDLLAALVIGFAVEPLKSQIHQVVTSRLFKGERPGDEVGNT